MSGKVRQLGMSDFNFNPNSPHDQNDTGVRCDSSHGLHSYLRGKPCKYLLGRTLI
jgi:hypothetical protein